MTYETSDQLDVSREAIKNLLMEGYRRSAEATKSGAMCVASYWDGYIRALQHVLEMEHE